MKKGSKPQDDIAVNARSESFRSSRSSILTKSLMQTVIPKIKQNIIVKKINLCDKSDYKQQPYCTICFRPFSMTFRRHHCRVCANACCSDCSSGKINDQKSCDVCYLKYSNYGDLQRKQKLIQTLETLCGYLMHNRIQKSEQLQKVKLASKEKSQQLDFKSKQDQEKQEASLKDLQNQALSLAQRKKNLSNQLNLLVQKNRKLQEEMMLLQRDNE